MRTARKERSRRACASRRDLFGDDLPAARPWDPVRAEAPESAGVAVDRLEDDSQDSSRTVEQARQLQGSAGRRFGTRLLDFRDWATYVHLAIVIPLVVLLPFLSFKYYEQSVFLERLTSAIVQGGQGYEQMIDLLESGPVEPWTESTEAREVTYEIHWIWEDEDGDQWPSLGRNPLDPGGLLAQTSREHLPATGYPSRLSKGRAIMITKRVLVWALVLLAIRSETLLRSQPTISTRELSTASPENVGLSTEKLSRIDSAMEALIENRKIAGAIVMVARRGQVAYAKAMGKMDIEAGKPMQLDTIFRIYSMTKPIVSVATMMLEEERRCQLDDPVSSYLPELRGLKVYRSGSGDDIELEFAEREMTVRDLLRHTAGLTYGLFSGTPVDRIYRERAVLGRGDVATMVRNLSEIPLLYQPGTRWHYSVSVDVLGHLVEVLSGKSLDVFLRERIFEPLDMRDTGFHVPPDRLHRFAANYAPSREGGLQVADAPATSRYRHSPKMLSGGGGLVSTARDYLRFCQMLAGYGELQGTRLLRRSTVELMAANQLPGELIPIAVGVKIKMEGVGFGLGFSVRVATSADSAGRVGEYGWSGAASTHFWISPRDDLIVVALSQRYPFSNQLERAVKPLVYDAIVER